MKTLGNTHSLLIVRRLLPPPPILLILYWFSTTYEGQPANPSFSLSIHSIKIANAAEAVCNIIKEYSFFSRNYDLSCFADANCEVRSAFLKSAQRSAQQRSSLLALLAKNRPFCAHCGHLERVKTQ